MLLTNEQLAEQLAKCTHLQGDKLIVHNLTYLQSTYIDSLIYTAVFSPEETVKTKSRQLITKIAETLGIYAASIYPLYQAIGRGEISGFTVPAMNIRALTYDTASVIFQLASQQDIGALVFEIARSEIEYTDQRPEEYTAAVLAAAIKTGYTGPVFLQGDHFQLSKTKYTADPEQEIEKVKSLTREAIEAQFFNIDIDASTLVDLTLPSLTAQQENNYEVTALLTNYIRSLEPKHATISIGGEIGHIGGKNSTVAEFQAFMEGYLSIIPENGISKVSVQTGTSHGGIPLADGKIADVQLDFAVLKDIGKAAREQYGIGGAVQHGASTLPNELFHKFQEAGTLEVHLATGFQNIVYDTMPKQLREEMYAWVMKNCQKEKEADWNDEQFVYKTRKKALGQFKKRLWDLRTEEKELIRQKLAEQFQFLFEQLRVHDTKKHISAYVHQANKPD